jgi:hypothetical protein
MMTYENIELNKWYYGEIPCAGWFLEKNVIMIFSNEQYRAHTRDRDCGCCIIAYWKSDKGTIINNDQDEKTYIVVSGSFKFVLDSNK